MHDYCVFCIHTTLLIDGIPLLWVVEDLERNNGVDKPYFMRKQLMNLLNAHNVKTSRDGTDGEGEENTQETQNL